MTKVRSKKGRSQEVTELSFHNSDQGVRERRGRISLQDQLQAPMQVNLIDRPETHASRWLDKAAVLESWEEEAVDRCTVQQVEELKKILRMAPVWLCASVSAIVYIQVTCHAAIQSRITIKLLFMRVLTPPHHRVLSSPQIELSILELNTCH